MPDYRRNRIAGGTYFFTVNLLDRNRPLLVEHIELLRESVRRVAVLVVLQINRDGALSAGRDRQGRCGG